ncbi:DUF397 domain-containing protein [Catellatospora coxensis]|uniref:DUF397 domain-containing protein n=1 Tax=Catellatospora coxensis TaxID=310354 RepID=A0A8J3L982_9ACTN|nr:DUF397 domain-containing protein [Catellatospora coxensis]GIG10791.1 hypothetical protein Cco03nite_74910 [Catellatospora coxensis]
MSVVETTVWLKSKRCDSNACVEVALIGQVVAMRDSKDPDGPILRFTRQEWDAFTAGLHEGDFASV